MPSSATKEFVRTSVKTLSELPDNPVTNKRRVWVISRLKEHTECDYSKDEKVIAMTKKAIDSNSDPCISELDSHAAFVAPELPAVTNRLVRILERKIETCKLENLYGDDTWYLRFCIGSLNQANQTAILKKLVVYWTKRNKPLHELDITNLANDLANARRFDSAWLGFFSKNPELTKLVRQDLQQLSEFVRTSSSKLTKQYSVELAGKIDKLLQATSLMPEPSEPESKTDS